VYLFCQHFSHAARQIGGFFPILRTVGCHVLRLVSLAYGAVDAEETGIFSTAPCDGRTEVFRGEGRGACLVLADECAGRDIRRGMKYSGAWLLLSTDEAAPD